AQPHAGVLLLQQRLLELFQGDQPFTDKDLAELVLGNRNASRMQLVEFEATKMGVEATLVKVLRLEPPKMRRTGGLRPAAWGLRRTHCRGGRDCQMDRADLATRRCAVPVQVRYAANA